jgi:DNA-damage-inducible protein J
MLNSIKTTDVRTRIEPELKEAASKLLSECGLSMSDGIRLFLRQVVTQRGLPFEVKSPNSTTIAAMGEARTITQARFIPPKNCLMTSKKNGSAKTN